VKKLAVWPDVIGGAALLTLTFSTYWWLNDETRMATWQVLACAFLPPAALVYIACKRTRQWAEYIALAMIPYCFAGVMDVVASSGNQTAPLIMSLAAILSFLAALDASRRYKD
jgi:uncharacterized membrane protein